MKQTLKSEEREKGGEKRVQEKCTRGWMRVCTGRELQIDKFSCVCDCACAYMRVCIALLTFPLLSESGPVGDPESAA